MKFCRYGAKGAEKPGLVDAAGRVRDLSGHIADVTVEAIAGLADVDAETLPLVEGDPRLGVPFSGISKIVVIGKTCRHVTKEAALDHVAGYVLVNDVSERFNQKERGTQWSKGKGHDTFCPVGPWLVTPDEVGDPQTLDMSLDVNGERMQTGNTKTMIFDVAELISYVSEYVTLEPGDLMITGTPPGVGEGKKPEKIFLKPGDTMTLAIDRLGSSTQSVVAFDLGRFR
ncbi:fumarylacetoacetate hydrolase family protein [Sphingomonas sp. RP10(2022)]|uniref:Fumarylacetoacetate hydrolase family protein n=1 Tax=Sphingomonas liriopis TaxID=2949094 RepID=A0A9X2KQL3_9SPHN|nr:fumarylacetoacetate hydrolase family protein [Sphingomonas liriopis]MCP3735864.1 fumarylacetoacetate hydrolase family protein [Sphingomonas liriopis]